MKEIWTRKRDLKIMDIWERIGTISWSIFDTCNFLFITETTSPTSQARKCMKRNNNGTVIVFGSCITSNSLFNTHTHTHTHTHNHTSTLLSFISHTHFFNGITSAGSSCWVQCRTHFQRCQNFGWRNFYFWSCCSCFRQKLLFVDFLFIQV